MIHRPCRRQKRYCRNPSVYFDEVYAALAGVDAAVLMTEWNAYRGMDLDRIKENNAR